MRCAAGVWGLALILLSAAGTLALESSELRECLEPLGTLVDASEPELLKSAVLLENLLFSNSTPVAVLYPSTTQAVEGAVKCARAAGVKVSVRNGGHSFMGYSVASGTLNINLSNLTSIQLAPDGRTAVVQGGARLGQLYHAVWQQAGNTTGAVGGTCSTVGISGVLLGGGTGFLGRQHGLGCDQVLALEMVDAEGQVVRASATENPDLLAASCGGGGGNFGIVTQFTLKLVEVPPLVTTFKFNISSDQALDFLLRFQQAVLVDYSDNRFSAFAYIRPTNKATAEAHPGLGPLHVKVKGQWAGGQQELERYLDAAGITGPQSPFQVLGLTVQERSFIESMHHWGIEAGVSVGPMLEDMADPATIFAQSRQNYFKEKSYFSMEPLTKKALKTMIRLVKENSITVQMHTMGPQSGYAGVPANATAFPWRQAYWWLKYYKFWTDGQDSDKWVHTLDEVCGCELNKYFPGKPGFINYIDPKISDDPLRSYYGDNLGWLRQVKRRFDPDNYFNTHPINIPAADPAAD